MFRESNLSFVGILVIIFVLLFTPLASAESRQVSTGNSTATVIIGDPEPPKVLDPENPDIVNPEVPGEDEKPTNSDKYLTLDYVSNIHFGKIPFSLNGGSYKSTTIKPFIQVTDQRPEKDAKGWTVFVKATPFNNTSGESVLDGATITYSNGGVTTPSTNPFKDHPPTAPSNIVIETNETQVKVVEAVAKLTEEAEGRGTWITRWFPSNYYSVQEPVENDNVVLNIPQGMMEAGTFTSTLTWTLVTGP